jgi:transposase-like protein
MEMVLQGVSTRKVEKVTEMLCGTHFSASLVSHLCKQMDEAIGTFRTRSLIKNYPYLIIDARYEKVRVDGQVVDQAVLIIVGVNEEGFREVLGVEVADLESESTWGDIFRQLKDRGLKGVRLLVSDDHRGLRKALTRYFTGCVWQRCRVHFVRNICGLVALRDRKELAMTLHQIWENTEVEAYKEDASWAIEHYQERNPKVARMLEEELEYTMQVMAFPEEHRKRLTTTNAVERVNQTIKTRTRIVRIFPNRESCIRLVTALLMELHEDWITGHRYLKFQEMDEERVETETSVQKEAVAVTT